MLTIEFLFTRNLDKSMLSIASRQKTISDLVRNRALHNHYFHTLLHSCYKCRRETRLKSINSILQRSKKLQKKESEYASFPLARRQMATALPYKSEDIPFERMNGSLSSMMSSNSGFGQSHSQAGISHLELMNLGNNMGPKLLRRGKLGLSGDFAEIIPVFEACVQIGRLDRARDILEKLYEKAFLTEYDAIRYSNIYLRAAVEHVMMNPTKEVEMQELHRWFQVNREVRLVPHDSETIGYMVKLSLQSEKKRRERLVTMYMDLLNEETFLDLIEADVLTGQEIGLVTEIYPKYNFALDFGEDLPDDLKSEKKTNLNPTSNHESPTVLATKQKGLGLSSLKKTLSLLNKSSIENFDLSNITEEERREFQKRLEEDAVQSAIERWRDENETLLKMGLNSALQSKSIGSRMWTWQVDLVKKIKEELELIEVAEAAETKSRLDIDRCMYGPLLRILSPEQVSAVTIIACMTMMGQHTDKRTPLSAVVMEIGRSIEDESTLYTILQAEKKEMWPTKTKRRLNPEFYMKLKRARGAGAASKHLNRIYTNSGAKPWPVAVKAKVGAILMSLLIDVAKVPARVKHPETNEELVQLQAAFTHAHQYKKGKKTGIILMNKVLVEQLQREPAHSLIAKQLPMVTKPDEWTAFDKGGYIAHPSHVMRIKLGDQEQRQYCEAAIMQGEMCKIFEGLDVLSKTPWRINKSVFNVMLEAWNTGEEIANFPAMNPQIDVPPEPVATTDPLERNRWIRQVRIAQNIKIGLHSQRCFQNFQLEIARAFQNFQFHFPHNIDFRGRAYPIPPYLNHIGADHCRGLLLFGIGKELGESGLRWLKIHISNVFGFDKASLNDREGFTTSKLEEIYDSAMYPLTGKRWWLKAEDPWQCLAASIELRNALESPDPAKYVSRLPIHQDGTCNGLQHYAALGGDVWGAKQVNLEPGERPADVYTAVADLVRDSIAKDKELKLPLAIYLDGKISRKTVKQTVMTNVYGVTFIGASAQVRKQLASSYPDLPEDGGFSRQSAAAYIARKIFAALSTMFSGAHNIQYWLADCANKITTSLNAQQISKLESEWDNIVAKQNSKKETSTSKNTKLKIPDIQELTAFKTSVIWTSPLGMPVVQPYRTPKGKVVRTTIQNLNLAEPTKNSPVSKRKQLQGFPPNFIHSLDASHMILSAIGCDKRGLSFAAVHDSFWTHACDVDTMNEVLRDCFVEIHSNNIIGRLAAEFKARYQNSMYVAKVIEGTPIFGKIRSWRVKQRKISKIKPSTKNSKELRFIEELLLESKRVRLLASSKPEEVEEGKAMETPGSLYEAWIKSDDCIVNQRDEEMFDSADRSVDVGTKENSEFGGNEGLDYEGKNIEDDERLSNEDSDELVTENEDVEVDAEPEELSKFEKTMNPSRVKKPKTESIWVPLVFNKIPEKGAFDISRLKKSKYFFS